MIILKKRISIADTKVYVIQLTRGNKCACFRYNIQKFYVVLTLRLCVLYGLLTCTALTGFV